jgi:hypothetical protein
MKADHLQKYHIDRRTTSKSYFIHHTTADNPYCHGLIMFTGTPHSATHNLHRPNHCHKHTKSEAPLYLGIVHTKSRYSYKKALFKGTEKSRTAFGGTYVHRNSSVTPTLH